MEQHARIFVAGHRGLVGSAICRKLTALGYGNLLLRSHQELDLTNQAQVLEFFQQMRPQYIFLAAAKVGGILANQTYPAEFIYQNLMIASNVIEASRQTGVIKLLNLGSSCIYPRMAPQPMTEDCLLTSPLEPTNEAYAIAKIAAIKLCRYYNQQYGTNYLSAMPTNQYGMHDNFNMETAHLLPMLMRRFHLAKLLQQHNYSQIRRDLEQAPLGWNLDATINLQDPQSIETALAAIGAYPDRVIVWGDGSVFRELMHADDLADACIYLMQHCNATEVGELVNITDGTEIQLKQLIELVANIVGYTGTIEYDHTKPNGTPRKLMDATKIKALGWSPKIELSSGIQATYQWYLQQQN